MGFLLFCFAGEKIDQDGQYKADNTPFPAFGVAGIAGSSQAEQDGKEGLFGIFFAVGKGLIVGAGQFLETFRADNPFISLTVFIDERILFFKTAATFRTFQHGGIPPRSVLILLLYAFFNFTPLMAI